MKKILVLGATGSIGKSGLDIIRQHPDKFCLAGMSAHKSADTLLKAAAEFNCKNLCLSSDSALHYQGINFYGTDGLEKLIKSTDCDIVLNGIAGAAGLMPSIAALESHKDLALANKETIVMAGLLIRQLAAKNNARILPVDSEHSAVFSLTQKYGKDSVDSIVLTASGGPFRNTPKEKLATVTLADTLKHPTWNMGQKITIDSATLANKGLEVIEACRLFDVPAEKVHVAVHPQSLVHSLIRTKDGVLYAQISEPDMRHPILQAFTWPELIPNKLKLFDLTDNVEMTFQKPRLDDFQMLPLAFEAAKQSGRYTIAYNAANEVAVAAFIGNQIRFLDIPSITKEVLAQDWSGEPADFGEVFEADKSARSAARQALSRLETL
ncbi:MAG: 1-deoxy-D-xylulose-5-phosphate reductoisomerase [Spirochaetaceae bacterium]|nr:1-deoxy-D-xylulose-5-phosphate reductoisomerase [Spirochaetaceae bacterium]